MRSELKGQYVAGNLNARAERWIDGLVEALVIAFALWTVAFHASVAMGWARDTALSIWVALLAIGALVAALALRRGRTSATSPIAPDGRASMPLFRLPRQVTVGFAGATVAVAGFGAYLDGSWAWWVFAAILAGLAGVATLLAIHAESRADVGSQLVSRRGAAAVIAIAVLFAVLSAVSQRPDADDVSYLSRAVHAEENSGAFATRDTVYGDETYVVVGGRPSTPLTAIEPLVGTVARLTPLTTPTVAYLLLGPLAAALGVFALFRLVRTLGAVNPALATATAALFLVLNGDQHASFGNFSFVRSWQGKAIFVSVVVPLAWHYALAWGQRRDGRSLLGLAAVNVAAIGLTTTAYLVMPIVTLLGVMCAVRGSGAARAVGAGAATLAYPVALLGAARWDGIPAPTRDWQTDGVVGWVSGHLAAAPDLLRAGASMLGRLPSLADGVVLQEHWQRILGDGLPGVVAVVSLLSAWLFVRNRAGRIALAAIPLALIVVYFNPFAAAIAADSGAIEQAGGSWWRSVWVAPVPAAVGIVAASIGSGVRTHARAAVHAAMVVLLAVAMLGGGRSVVSAENRGVRLDGLAWDVDPAARAAAARAISMAPRDATVAVPQEVGEVLAVMSARVHPLLVRNLEFAVPVLPEDQVADRFFVLGAITHGVSAVDGTSFGEALRRLGIDVVVTRRPAESASDLRQVLYGAGLRREGQDADYSYWLRNA